MTKRTKKLLSLLLASAMVFTMNTSVFAEEVAVDSVEEVAAEATVDAAEEVAEEATVDAVVDEEATKTTTAATSKVSENISAIYGSGIRFTETNGKYVATTTIDFESNDDKKKAEENVAVIKNVSDPISWNNNYSAALIDTVLYGSKGKDTWLNNTAGVTVSADSGDRTVYAANGQSVEVPHLVQKGDSLTRAVIPVVDGSEYLFIGYSVGNGTDSVDKIAPLGREGNNQAYVAGYDGAKTSIGTNTRATTIPVVDWDGRQVEYNKSGVHKYTTGKKEALDVKMSFVTYDKSTGTLKEVNGVDVSGVKLEKKNMKAASVEFDASPVGISEKTGDKTETYYVAEHKVIGELPYFTIKAKITKDGKDYKKAINEKLKDEKFYFGIMQQPVDVTSGVDKDKALSTVIPEYGKLKSLSDNNGLSSNDLVSANELVNTALTKTSMYADMDRDKVVLDTFEISKFKDGKANIVVRGYVGDDKDGEVKNLKSLKGKGNDAEYSLVEGKVANEEVHYLKFEKNYVYRPFALKIDTKGTGTRYDSNPTVSNLAPYGFKWAFRKSPIEKSKKFRYGIYKADNQGFVYSVDDTAVDSVEEAF